MKKANSGGISRKGYSAPALRIYGNMADLTASGSGTMKEGGAKESDKFP